jgi:hypothetical protein
MPEAARHDIKSASLKADWKHLQLRRVQTSSFSLQHLARLLCRLLTLLSFLQNLFILPQTTIVILDSNNIGDTSRPARSFLFAHPSLSLRGRTPTSNT